MKFKSIHDRYYGHMNVGRECKNVLRDAMRPGKSLPYETTTISKMITGSSISQIITDRLLQPPLQSRLLLFSSLTERKA